MIFSQAVSNRLKRENNKKKRSPFATRANTTSRPASSSRPAPPVASTPARARPAPTRPRKTSNSKPNYNTIMRRTFGLRNSRTDREVYTMLRNRGIKHKDILDYAKNTGRPMRKSAYQNYKA